MPSRIDDDVVVKGRLTPDHLTYPANELTDAAVAGDAGIGAQKLEHQHEQTYAQPNTAAADATQVVHVVHGATGEVLEFEAGSIAKCVGDATVTVDLRKNGSTILSAVITLDSSSTNYVPQPATIASGDLVAGDVLTVVVDATLGTGTLATGVFASVKLREKAD